MITESSLVRAESLLQPRESRILSLSCFALLASACQQTQTRIEPRPVAAGSAVRAHVPRAPVRALNGGTPDTAGSANAGECVTLLAQDPFGWSWSFRNKSSGVGLQESGPVNLNAEIAFDLYRPDAFSVGISGGEKGAIVDLGTSDELADRFHFTEFMGGGHGFASLQYASGQLMICTDDPNRPLQPLTDFDSELRKLQGSASAPVHEGHIYLVHLEDSDRTEPVTAKLFVTAHEPHKSVRFRWLPVKDANKVARAAGAPRSTAGRESAGTLTTLYANDPLASTLDLRSGLPGMVVQAGEVRNQDSHICLGYYPDCLTVGIQGGDQGAIVDLGTAQEAAAATSSPIVGNGGNVYVAIRLPWVREHAALQHVAVSAHAPVKAGHIYLVRIVNQGKPDIHAKLIVLEFRPGELVTFRWQRLDD